MFKEDFTREWEQMQAAFDVLASGRGHIDRVRVRGKYKKMTVEGPRKQQQGPAADNPFYFLKR